MDMSPSKRSAKRIKLISLSKLPNSDENVLISLGNNEYFSVPKEIFTTRSSFFSAACSPRWSSGVTNTIHLPHEDADLFFIFVSYASGSGISMQSCVGLTSSESQATSTTSLYEGEAAKERRMQWYCIARCYKLGDVLLAPGFKNAVMGLVVQNMKEAYLRGRAIAGVRYPDLEVVFGGLPSGSPLRRLVRDMRVAEIEEFLDTYDSSIPYIKEFYREVRGDSWSNRRLTGLRPWEKDICEYHDHPGHMYQGEDEKRTLFSTQLEKVSWSTKKTLMGAGLMDYKFRA